MTPSETIWLAGYLEGEGCFVWQKSIKSGKEYRYPLIQVVSTDRDVIEKAAKIMGSAKPFLLRQNNPGKPLWRTQIGGKMGLAIMGLILPHMGNRRTQRITELFRLSASRPGTPRGAKAYQAKLTPQAVEEIRNSERRFQRGFQAEMARKYGVYWGTVNYVRRGLTWKEACTDMAATLVKS